MSILSAPAASNDRGAASRFASLPPARAAAVLVALAALMALSLFYTSHPQRVPPLAHAVNGFRLYGAIVKRMRGGESYETAAVSELRAEGGPLKPFVTVRPPALATALAWLPDQRSAAIALMALAGITLGAWAIRLRACRPSAVWLGWVVAALFCGIGPPLLTAGPMSLFHEAWAGLLIALSLALRTERRFLAAALVGCLAALIRELTLPYLLVMVIIAFAERRRGEGAAFALALAAALAALAWHASAVMALTTPQDFASPGWAALAGWGFVLSTARWNALVALLGPWAAAMIVPAALVGALGRRDGLGLRLSVLLIGYSLGFMVIGRPSNSYWGLVTTPLFAVGLALAPIAIADLLRAAAGRPARASA